MVFALICFAWIGLQLDAPWWYFGLLIAWVFNRTIQVCYDTWAKKK